MTGEPSWLQRGRAAAAERFQALGWPSTRDEEWRYTSLAPLQKTRFLVAERPAPALGSADLEPFLLFEPSVTRLTFVNGHYAPELSSVPALRGGAYAGSLRAALGRHPETLRAALDRASERALPAANAAHWRDGAFLFLPRGVALEHPVHLLYLAAPHSDALAFHPRNLLLAERGSRAVVVETYAALDASASWTNAVTEARLGPDAALEHYRVQEEAEQAFHTGLLQAQLERNARLTSHVVTRGGALSRSEVRVRFAGEGGECTLNGLYWIGGGQHADHLTEVDHAAARCTSHQTYRGVIDGRARGIFNGRIHVRSRAQHSDAHQSNKNLLLSEQATADSKPELEIEADDVRCTHGVAIGQLDRDALFYLRSRGLGLDQARGVLTRAFASAVTEQLRVPSIRCRLDRMLALELPDERALVLA